MTAAQLRRRDRFEELTFQAYQTVKVWALTKSKKGRMPRFESLLPRESGEDAMSVGQMRAAMAVVSKQYGDRMKVRSRSSV